MSDVSSLPEMNVALEFHDSKVRRVEPNADALTVSFAAAHVHRSTGRPAIDAGSGYAQSVDMVFSGAVWRGPVPECVGRLAAGQVVAHGVARSLIDLPYVSTGPVAAEFQFANGALLSVTASALVCRFIGEPRFIESFAC